MKFLKLTDYKDEVAIYVNIDTIDRIQALISMPNGSATAVALIGSLKSVFFVKETPEEIIEMLNEERSQQ